MMYNTLGRKMFCCCLRAITDTRHLPQRRTDIYEVPFVHWLFKQPAINRQKWICLINIDLDKVFGLFVFFCTMATYFKSKICFFYFYAFAFFFLRIRFAPQNKNTENTSHLKWPPFPSVDVKHFNMFLPFRILLHF